MVTELDITDQDVADLANMIDNEIATLVPEWRTGVRIEENSECSGAGVCLNCAANGYLVDYVSSNNPCGKNLQFLHCSKNGCAAIHGRFEEITYQVEGSASSDAEGARDASSHPDGIHYTDIWAQRDEPELCHEELKDIHCDQTHEASNPLNIKEEGKAVNVDEKSYLNTKRPHSNPAINCVMLDCENEIRQELRWLKAKYQMQLRELRDQQLGVKPKFTCMSPDTKKLNCGKDGIQSLSAQSRLKIQKHKPQLRSIVSGKHFPLEDEKCNNYADQMVQNVEEINQSNSPERMLTAKDFFTGALFPNSLQRATSLPVDAIDF